MMKEVNIILDFKHWLRLKLFPFLANLLHFSGISWKSLGNSKIGVSTLIAQAKMMARSFGKTEAVKGEKLNILMLTMLGGHTHNLSFEIILAWALKFRGHRIRFVLDDGALPMTEDFQIGKETKYYKVAKWAYRFGNSYITSSGFEVIKLSSLLETTKGVKGEISNEEYNSLVEAALLKHYRVGLLSNDLPLIDEKRQLFEKSVKITNSASEAILGMSPDRVVMSHGIYTTWGVIFDKLNKQRVPILTYGRGKKANTKKFNWNKTSDWWDVSEEWEKVKNQPLNLAQNQQIDDYLKSRVSHKNDVLVYNFGALESREATLKRFELDASKPVYSLFTNVLWDAASAQREIAFHNPVEWVMETIEWFVQHPDKQLIVKIHPAEQVIGTNQPFAQLVKQKFTSLPANIKLIEPHEKVNSWSIYSITDLGIVHTTTVGMELPLLGIPCIVVSLTHYREKGFTVDVSNKENYFRYLADFDRESHSLDKKYVNLARRYAFLLFERYQIPINVFNELGPLQTRSLRIKQLSDVLNNENISLLVNAIEEKSQILLDGNK